MELIYMYIWGKMRDLNNIRRLNVVKCQFVIVF